MNSVKILGKEYRIKTDADADPEHIERVAAYVDGMMRDVQRTTPDTQDAAILAALNIASEMMRLRDANLTIDGERIRALIELVDSV